MVAGHQAARLQRGGDPARFLVDLRPRHERVAIGRLHAVADEAHARRPLGGSDQAVDDRVGCRVVNRVVNGSTSRWHTATVMPRP